MWMDKSIIFITIINYIIDLGNNSRLYLVVGYFLKEIKRMSFFKKQVRLLLLLIYFLKNAMKKSFLDRISNCTYALGSVVVDFFWTHALYCCLAASVRIPRHKQQQRQSKYYLKGKYQHLPQILKWLWNRMDRGRWIQFGSILNLQIARKRLWLLCTPSWWN